MTEQQKARLRRARLKIAAAVQRQRIVAQRAKDLLTTLDLVKDRQRVVQDWLAREYQDGRIKGRAEQRRKAAR